MIPKVDYTNPWRSIPTSKGINFSEKQGGSARFY